MNGPKIATAINNAIKNKRVTDEATAATRIGVSTSGLASLKKTGTQDEKVLKKIADIAGVPVAQLR